MIIDSIKNASAYYRLSPGIEAALNWLQKTDLFGLEEGRHDIDGDNCYAIIQEYKTKPAEDCYWEAHRKYIDIQYVASGSELMGFANIEELVVEKDYDASKDKLVLDGDGDFFVLSSGYFAIFFPQDAHMPQVALEKPEQVRKVVIKVAAD